MNHYKDNKGNLHSLSDQDVSNGGELLLPPECIKITDEEAAEMQKQSAPDYRQLRAMEYPPITDYLDGVVKGDQAQVQDYINSCLSVKAKYPKSE